MGDKHSSSTTELSEVPEVSVLGPLLFVIYINDLNDKISSKNLRFASDSKLCRELGEWRRSADTGGRSTNPGSKNLGQ